MRKRVAGYGELEVYRAAFKLQQDKGEIVNLCD
jgi:hypothetical protein